MARDRPTPRRVVRTRTLQTATAQAHGFKIPRSKFRKDEAIHTIRREIQRIKQLDPNAIIVIRGEGGTKEYPTRWWSTLPVDVSFFDDATDEDIAAFAYELEDSKELDIYHRTE